jgi:hypothetical protein
VSDSPLSELIVAIAELRSELRHLREGVERIEGRQVQQEGRQLAVERGQSPMLCRRHDQRIERLEKQNARIVLAVVVSSLGGGGVVAAAMRLLPVLGG